MATHTLDSDKELLKKERRRVSSALWRKNNPEKNKRLKIEWNERNPGHAARKAKAWRAANPEKWKAGAKKNRLRTLSTPEGRLNHNMRGHMSRCLSKTKETIGQLKRSLPYTIAELRVHLERQFLPGMSWNNRKDWHIDHIIPLSSFKFTSSTNPEFQAAWALTNLRPMWAKENVVKGKKRTVLL